MSSKLVGSDIPGLQVPVPLRFLWLFSGIILLALANANLAYLMAVPTVAPVVENFTSHEAVSESDDGLAALCTLSDLICDSENVTATTSEVPIQSNPVGVMADKLGILKSVCIKHSLGEQCARDLYAIAFHESRFDCSVVGDSGRSFGCFQIQVKMHKVSKDFARDFEKAADWTLKRMIGNGYDKGFRTYAVLRHNGFGPMAQRYASRVIATSNNLK